VVWRGTGAEATEGDSPNVVVSAIGAAVLKCDFAVFIVQRPKVLVTCTTAN
jgi:hypothetical protein